ncbi:MAG TPA: phage virion morphogenesis protein [Helicobacter sp.]|nr:phage virion morphogenesis protein [Helicobacter sp.]
MAKITLNDLIKDIDYTIKQCENLHPLLDRVADKVYNASMESFDKESSPFGEKWQPLAKSTLKHKTSNKILRDTSTLQSSINSRTKLQTSKTSTQGSVSIGTNLEYAKIHQFGGKAGRGLKVNIPERPFLPVKDNEIPNDLKEDLKEAILSHFKFGR